MTRGDIEAALFADIPALTLAATFDVKVAALGKQGFSSIVTVGNNQVRDLKGKKIGNAVGSTAHYALLRALASAGLKESDVELVSMEAVEMPGALINRKIDAFAAWEPTPGIALAGNPNALVVNRFISMSFLYFSTSFTEKNPYAARQIVASLVRAINWLKKDRKNLIAATRWTMEEYLQLKGKEFPLSLEQAASLVQNDLLSIPSSPVIPIGELQENGYLRNAFEFLKTQGMLPPTAQWDKTRRSFDNTLLTDVLSRSAAYRLKQFDYSQ